MIEIEEICHFIDGHSNPMEGSREILSSGYLQKVGILADSDEKIVIRGLCICVSTLGEEPFVMDATISKPYPGYVIKAICNCKGGKSGKCKHAVAMLRSVMGSVVSMRFALYHHFSILTRISFLIPCTSI